DESQELYPSRVWRDFIEHIEIVTTQDAASLLSNSEQSDVKHVSHFTATGRELERFTQQGGITLEDAIFGHDLFGNVTSLSRLHTATGDSAVTTWRYNGLGKVIQLNEPGSLPQYRSYNSWGALKTVSWTDTSRSPSVDRRQQYTYDPLGRVVDASLEDYN